VIAFGPNRMVGIDPEEPLFALLALASTNCLADEAASVPAAAGDAAGDGADPAVAARRAARWERMLGGRTMPAPAPGDELPGATPGTIIVQPLMSRHWNQYQPYNDYNPRVPDDSGHAYYRRHVLDASATQSGAGEFRTFTMVDDAATKFVKIVAAEPGYAFPQRFADIAF